MAKTINDYVEDMFVRLYDEDPESFGKLIEYEDKVIAAAKIRERASDDSPLKDKDLKTIYRSLKIVLRRYGKS